MRYVVLAGLLAVVATGCAFPIGGFEPPKTGSTVGAMTSSDVPTSSDSPAPAVSGLEESEEATDSPGYPTDRRLIGNPTDIDVDLATSFPKEDSVLPGLIPKAWFEWKEKLAEDTGLQLGLSYQSLYHHAVNAGAAMLKPLGIRGEAGLGVSWAEPINDALRDQYGGEVYWKILLTPDLWLTPGGPVHLGSVAQPVGGLPRYLPDQVPPVLLRSRSLSRRSPFASTR